jgi:catechol-2,3-dioxygenase
MKRRDFMAASTSAALLTMLEAHNLWATSSFSTVTEIKQPLIHSLRLLTTSPIRELKDFYGKVLGLPVSATGDQSLTVQAGKSSITFTKTDEHKTRPFYHFAFNIPENKIEKAFAWQRSRTPIIHPNPSGPKDAVVNFQHWNAHSIFFLDPAGNLLEYIARHDLQNAVEGEFSVTDILYASEIGFIVDDVEQTGSAIKNSLHLNSYRPSENFMPIGDEYGLLLMIQKGKVWTSHPNQVNQVGIFKTSVSISNLSAGQAGAAQTGWKSPNYPYEILVG